MSFKLSSQRSHAAALRVTSVGVTTVCAQRGTDCTGRSNMKRPLTWPDLLTPTHTHTHTHHETRTSWRTDTDLSTFHSLYQIQPILIHTGLPLTTTLQALHSCYRKQSQQNIQNKTPVRRLEINFGIKETVSAFKWHAWCNRLQSQLRGWPCCKWYWMKPASAHCDDGLP